MEKGEKVKQIPKNIQVVVSYFAIVLYVVISGYAIYQMLTFQSQGDRYTACDGALHEHIYHSQKLPEECFNQGGQ